MRISSSVRGWVSSGIFFLVFLILTAIPAHADTGTYQLSDYVATLEPRSDGQVMITIDQQWQVLSGDIPWVTVGLPNKNFSIENYGGAVSKMSSANGNGFFGVRIDLDKDYKPGQSFEVKFTVLQGGLLEKLTSDKKWRINYTPGWYDSASINHLQINLVSPVDYQTYSSMSPTPSSVNNNIIVWERLNLSPGAHLNIAVESTDGSFLSSASSSGPSQGNGLGSAFYVIVAIILVVGLVIFLGIRNNRKTRDAQKERVVSIEKEMATDNKKKEEIEKGFDNYVEEKNIEPDTEGRYYDRSYGNYITPAIWAGIIANQSNRQQTNPLGSGSAGCVSCACVSCACACACACAGGGAAGCSRKSLHECRTCSIFKEGIMKTDTLGTT